MIAIACQFLVPIGYMPGSFADGTPFVLCESFGPVPAPAHHDAAAAPLHTDMPNMPAAAAHNEHEQHLGAEAWEHCPLGALSAGAALAYAIDTVVAAPDAEQIVIDFAAQPRGVSVFTLRARAPPQPA